MSGFGFGGGAWDLTTGLKHLQEIGEQFQHSMAESLNNVEAQIDASIRQDRFGTLLEADTPAAPDGGALSPVREEAVEDSAGSSAAQADEQDGPVEQLAARAVSERDAVPPNQAAADGQPAATLGAAVPLPQEQQQPSPAAEQRTPEPQQTTEQATGSMPKPPPEPAPAAPPPAVGAAAPPPLPPAVAMPADAQHENLLNGSSHVVSTLAARPAVPAPQKEAPHQPPQMESAPPLPLPPQQQLGPPQGQLLLAEPAGLEATELVQLVQRLREALAAREQQIARQAEEAASTQRVVEQLQQKNEELAMSKAKVSEQDLAAIQREAEARLATAERKVYALTKERDALKRGSDKLSGMDDLVREKDAIIKQVMEEGEALSRKQLQQETTIKKLRGQVKELQGQVTDLTEQLAAEQGRAQSAATERASAAGELATLREQHACELAAERQHFERLLQDAQAAQAAAEQKAAEAAKAGTARRLRDAEARAENLETTLGELRGEMERQQAAADEREDLLSGEVAALQRRCAEAEARQQELQARVPEATRPLLRQIEAMQEAASQQAAAWVEAERLLQQRLAAARSAAEEASEQQATLQQRLDELREEIVGLRSQLAEARQAAEAAQGAVAAERQQRLAAEASAGLLRADLASAQESLATLERVYSQQLDALQSREAAAVSSARQLEETLASSKQQDGPPALAAPGYQWVLVRDGEAPPAAAAGKQLPVDAGRGSTPAPEGAAGSAGRGSPGAVQAQANSSEITAAEDESVKVGGATLWSSAATSVGAWQAPSGSTGRGRESQLEALQRAVQELEATRERLSEELVRVSTEAAAGRAAVEQAAALEQDVHELQLRLEASMELLGEKEEALDELQTDLVELKDNYRKQVEFLADELTRMQKQQR